MTVGASILAALVFLVKFGKFTDLIKRFGVYILIGAIFELYSYLLVFVITPENVTSANNLYLLHLFTLIEFIFIGLFFEKLFNLFNLNLATRTILVIGTVLIILNSIFLQPITVYNSFSRSAVQLLFMGCCFVGFYLFTQRAYEYKDRGAVKLILIALLLKYSGSLFLYLFSNQMAQLPEETQKNIWVINPSLNLLAQVIILVALIGLITSVKKAEDKRLKKEFF